MKRPAKVDSGSMHGRDMTQEFLAYRMPVSRRLIHHLLEMMRGPRHGEIGQQGEGSRDRCQFFVPSSPRRRQTARVNRPLQRMD